MRSPIRFIISFKFKGWLLPFVLGMVVLPFLDGTSTIAAQSSRIFTDAVAWSPDGNLIAYGTGPDNCSGCVRFGVSVMKSQLVRLCVRSMLGAVYTPLIGALMEHV